LSEPERAWPTPEAGQIVWCRVPELPGLKPARKSGPALILTVFDDEPLMQRVLVVYGTSQRTDKLYAGEFRIEPADGEAFTLSGLSCATKFNLNANVELPFSHTWFAPPPGAPWGQIPKLGVMHPSLYKHFQAALVGSTLNN
jgi:mRNA-degrading endonuclease toxin of MazEF toxin-antitoxin module